MLENLQQIWQIVVDSKILNVIGALIILLVGWIIAQSVSLKISRIVRRAAVTHNDISAADLPPVEHADSAAGKVAYWLIMLLVLLGCFSVLQLDAAARPLHEFISKVARFIPNIIGALLLVFFAWISAKFVRSTIKRTVMKIKLDDKLTKNPEAAASFTASAAYYMVWLFFLPAILNALAIYGITQPLQSMFEKALTFLPNLLAAAAICTIGLWAAAIVKRAVSGLVVISRLNDLTEKAHLNKFFGSGGASAMAGSICYILIALPVIISALAALKIEVLSRTVGNFLEHLLAGSGEIIGAMLLLFAAFLIAVWASNFVQQLCAAWGLDNFMENMGFKSEKKKVLSGSAAAGKIVSIAIMILALLGACDILELKQLAALIKSFASFGGHVLLSIIVLMIGTYLANFAAVILNGKCSDLSIRFVRIVIIIFTLALAIKNLDIGGSIVEITFALMLGAASVAAAIAFGIGGRAAAAELLNSWVEKLHK